VCDPEEGLTHNGRTSRLNAARSSGAIAAASARGSSATREIQLVESSRRLRIEQPRASTVSTCSGRRHYPGPPPSPPPTPPAAPRRFRRNLNRHSLSFSRDQTRQRHNARGWAEDRRACLDQSSLRRSPRRTNATRTTDEHSAHHHSPHHHHHHDHRDCHRAAHAILYPRLVRA